MSKETENTETKQAPTPGIATLLPALMREIGGIGKDRENSGQKYKFRGIDDVLNKVGNAAAKLGVRVEVETVDHKEDIERYEEYNKKRFRVFARLRMILRFYAPDGSCHTCSAVGSAIDTQGDKATNKAMSAAFKYACFLGLVIPVDGALDDSDSANAHAAINTEVVATEIDDADWHSWVVPFKGSKSKGLSLGQMVIESSREDIWSLNESVQRQLIVAEKDNNAAKYDYYKKAAGYTARALKERDDQDETSAPASNVSSVPGI